MLLLDRDGGRGHRYTPSAPVLIKTAAGEVIEGVAKRPQMLVE